MVDVRQAPGGEGPALVPLHRPVDARSTFDSSRRGDVEWIRSRAAHAPPRPLLVPLGASVKPTSTLDDWRRRGDVEWVRAQSADDSGVLRRAVESLLREFDATGDEAVGVAASVALQAFVLARTDRGAPDLAGGRIRGPVDRPRGLAGGRA